MAHRHTSLHWGRDMPGQLNRANLSIASPSEIERTALQLRIIREGFLTTGSLAIHTPRSMILESWRRCNAMHVNPSRRCAPLAVARESQLDQLREVNRLLISATRSVMDRLTDFLADSGYVVVLSDAKGCLLAVVGDTAIRRRLARIDFVPGGNWSEAAAGTNAIGTALSDGHVVQLMAAEHYCDGWQDLTCTAAPIRHPFTHEIIGILDVTGDYHLIRPFLTNSLAAAALEVQQELRTLLTPIHGGQQQQKKVVTVATRAGMSLPFEITMDNNIPWRPGGENLSETHTVDAMRLRINLEQRRAHDAERLAAAACAISASLDLDVALEKVAEQMAHLLCLESAAVFLFGEAGEITSFHSWSRLLPVPRTGWRDQSRQHAELADSLRDIQALLEGAEALSLVLERGEPVIIDDVRSSNILPAADFEKAGIRSVALLPLVSASGVIGCIFAPKATPYQWAVDDVRLGLALVAQSATAIENARLFDILQQHNRRIEVLNALAQLLNTLPDPNRHLDLVLERITEVMQLDAGLILLLEQHTGSLYLASHFGLPEEVPLELYEYPLRVLHEVACLIVASGESLLVDGMAAERHAGHEPLCDVGFCDLMAVPLVASNTILGVLLVGSHAHRGLKEEDLALFTTIGQQLGLTLKNAQLLRSASEMEAMREADRLKSGFIAAVSHDLRSPLTAIRASVESLLDRGGSRTIGEHEHLLYNIAGQAGRLGRLVDQLLDLSRIEAGALPLDRDWTELPVLIADTLAKFESLNSSCRIERSLAADLPLHYVDPDRFVQVLWNLLENASKYSSSSSPIRVEARWTGSEVLIEVADRGPGIPPGERERIFQHFYRLDRDQRAHTLGSGLGLAICRGIVEAHNGRIWVEDRPGGGCIFLIALPLPPPDPTGPEAAEEHELYTVSTGGQ
jgi:signal transduction histidine kinase